MYIIYPKINGFVDIYTTENSLFPFFTYAVIFEISQSGIFYNQIINENLKFNERRSDIIYLF